MRSPTSWPDSPRALAGRAAPGGDLPAKVGIEVRFDREGKARTRIIQLTPTSSSPAPEKPGVQPSAPSASPAPIPKSDAADGFEVAERRTVANEADGSGKGLVQTVPAKSLGSKAKDAADGADANITPGSARRRATAPAGGGVYEADEAVRRHGLTLGIKVPWVPSPLALATVLTGSCGLGRSRHRRRCGE
jgi:hypothetical protein